MQWVGVTGHRNNNPPKKHQQWDKDDETKHLEWSLRGTVGINVVNVRGEHTYWDTSGAYTHKRI